MRNRPFFGTWISSAVCAALFLSTAHAGVMVPIPSDPLTIDSGKVAGTLFEPGVRAYFGLPFAAPPVGELRWHAPMPVKPWKGIYNADTPAPECAQRLYPSRMTDAAPRALPQSEDCLYLNVWTPTNAKPGAKLPVIVWIHGGGFRDGTPSIPAYSGAGFAKKGVILVGIAYRLNVFGFLAHSQLSEESGHNSSGNWGMLDQIAALEWVKRNIAVFGGDPANVTIMGQSAGSMSASLLQSSPLAHGLFAKVVGWSGSFLPPGSSSPPSLKDAEASGLKLQEALHAKSLADMRLLAWDRVLAAAEEAKVPSRAPVDGYFLPDSPENIFKAGKQSDVPIYVSGTAKDIGSSNQFFMMKTLADFQKVARDTYGEHADEFLHLFPASNDAEAVKQARAVVGYGGLALSNRDWARAQSRSGKQPAYLVQFARVQPYDVNAKWISLNIENQGASHSSDIPYWFGTFDPQPGEIKTNEWSVFEWGRNWMPWDRELSEKMQNTLIAFVKTGNPSTDAVKVPRYEPENEQRSVFGDKIYTEKMDTTAIEFLRLHPPSGPRP
jgi:para-nitrobenzyl esterase